MGPDQHRLLVGSTSAHAAWVEAVEVRRGFVAVRKRSGFV